MKTGKSILMTAFALAMVASQSGAARAEDSVQAALEREFQAATRPTREQLKLGGNWECSVFRDIGKSQIYSQVFRFLPAASAVYMNTGGYSIKAFALSDKSLTATQYCDSWQSRKRQIWIRMDQDGNLIAKEVDNCRGSRQDSWIVGPRTSYFSCAAELVEGAPLRGEGDLNELR